MAVQAWILLLAATLGVGARPNSAPRDLSGRPAFLDAFDEIRVGLPEPSEPRRYSGRILVTVAGRAVPVASVAGGEPAPTVRGPEFVSIPGTIQSALGGRDWDPSDDRTQMSLVRPNVYELVVRLPAGRYEYKLARGGGWEENYGRGFEAGGANIALALSRPQVVRFVADFASRTIRDSVNHPNEVSAPMEAPERPRSAAREPLYQSLRVRLGRKLSPSELPKRITVSLSGAPARTVAPREVLSDPAFRYEGNDLGSRWSRDRTVFKVWSPAAESADLILFPSESSAAHRVVRMRRGGFGVWYATVPGDLHRTFYQYRFRSLGETRTAADVNCFAASVDSRRSMVVDLGRTNPAGWPAQRPFEGRRQTDAVLYELHVRDFTIDPSSGISPQHRGKYLAFTELGTQIAGARSSGPRLPTGLSYLKDLGVTHVHLLPIQDFSFDRTREYGWGYETTLFNVPEEQYAVDRARPEARIREVKRMIAAMQRQGIGVVLDVVYNHSVPSEGEGSAFWQTVPYYYFRTNDRGDVLNESGVGNALHDERPMVRKYILDSLRYWAREYRVDGFRFDLLGMFTRATIHDLAKAIRSVNPSAIVYGEPWTGGGPLRTSYGDQRGSRVALFNDRFRGAFRGDLDGSDRGFAMGGRVDPGRLRTLVSGSIDDFAASPEETVNYVSAHDNLTLRDRVLRAMPDDDPAQRERAVRLALASVLLSQGVPFLEGGVEVGRTKGMNHNSYNAGDAGNRYDWVRALEFVSTHRYVRGMVRLRLAEPSLRLGSSAEVRNRMRFLPAPTNALAWTIDRRGLEGRGRETLVVLNGSLEAQSLRLPPGDWDVLADPLEAGTQPIRVVRGSLALDPLSSYVLRR